MHVASGGAGTPRFCPIQPGQTCYSTREHEVLCADCVLNESLICVRSDLSAGVKCDRLLVRRVKAEVEALLSEIRHLVNALAEAVGRLVYIEAQED